MGNIHDVFEWQLKANSDGASFIPPKHLRVVGSKFQVVPTLSAISNNEMVNTVVRLHEDDNTRWPYFILADNSSTETVVLYWCQLVPYYE